MNIIEILLISTALAIDAMMVSFSYGFVICSKRIKYSLMLAFAFGMFQFIMPILGWYCSGLVYDILEQYSKWIVFCVFILLGLKFLKGALEKKKEENYNSSITILFIIWLALLTSIDAFGAGVSFKFSSTPLIKASAIIGLITFLLSFTGFWTACVCKKINSKNIEFVCCLIFIILAIKSIL